MSAFVATNRPGGDVQDALRTYAEAGDYLGVSSRTIRRLVDAGELRAINVGTSAKVTIPRIRQSELDRFVAAREAGA